MPTVCLQIGNTDNKLTQQEWAEFCNAIHKTLLFVEAWIHFSAPSVGWADWQNACWVFTCKSQRDLDFVQSEFIEIRKRFKQDSVAWLKGFPELI